MIDTWSASCGPQQLAKEPDRGKTIPLRLHEDVEDDPVLIDSSPEVVSDAIDLEEDFVQMPFVTGSSTPSSQAVGILLAELVAPAPDRFVADAALPVRPSSLPHRESSRRNGSRCQRIPR